MPAVVSLPMPAPPRACDASPCACRLLAIGYASLTRTHFTHRTNNCAASVCPDCVCARAKPTPVPTACASARSCSFRLSLLGGVSCVYSKCSARDSTDIDFNGQRNGQLHSARRSVEDRLTAIRRRADNCPCAVWQPAPSVAGRQRWGIRAGRERRLAIRSRRAHKAIIIIAAEGRIQPVRHSTRYL